MKRKVMVTRTIRQYLTIEVDVPDVTLHDAVPKAGELLKQAQAESEQYFDSDWHTISVNSQAIFLPLEVQV